MTNMPPTQPPTTDEPPMDAPAPPLPLTAESVPPPVMPPPPAAAKPGKLRAWIPIIVIGAILAVVLYAVRNNQSAGDLAIGTCFDVPTSSDFSTVEKRACTEPHDGEVILAAEYTEGDTYPISLAVDRFLSEKCFPAFATYVGVAYEDSTKYDMSYFMPTRDAWDDGQRTFTCYVHDINNAKLATSVKGGGS